jgi:hypothetical protein
MVDLDKLAALHDSIVGTVFWQKWDGNVLKSDGDRIVIRKLGRNNFTVEIDGERAGDKPLTGLPITAVKQFAKAFFAVTEAGNRAKGKPVDLYTYDSQGAGYTTISRDEAVTERAMADGECAWCCWDDMLSCMDDGESVQDSGVYDFVGQGG